MKRLLFQILLLAPLVFCIAQQQTGTFTTDPITFSENEEITITVSGIDPSVWGVTDVYLWAWYFDSTGEQAGDSPTNGTWQNSNESQRMTDNGDGTYSYTLTPATFYNATGISQIGMLVKAKDGTGDKKTQDHLIDVGGYQVVLTMPTQTTTIVDAGTNLSIAATASVTSSFVLKANDIVVDDSVTSSIDYSYTFLVNTTTNFQLEVTNGSETVIRTFTAAVSPTVTEEIMPNGLLDGINLDPNDPTKATLVFYAPGKEFVHVVGDFNNWQIDNNYLMKKDFTRDRFWLELTGLTPQSNHLYQYTVEYGITVADPYSTLILDGYGNDSFINDTTYPNIPDYPQSQADAITVLRTGDPEYNWQVTDFQKPAKEDLVIYELLIRDFDALHSFDAVKNRLDYLEDLGINAIEFMPVNEFDGNESWGYNPAFHMALDKYYGTKDAFKALIDECHARGIAVIIDVVYNHASGQHPYYRLWNNSNGGTGGQATADSPFFNISATHSYSVFNDFNHQQQGVKDYVNRTVTYWIEEFKIDGMRWDLTKGFTQNCQDNEGCTNSTQNDRIEVLKGYADNQWASDPDFYVIFEHLGGIQEEEQWANYRIEEGKGIMLWNKMTEPYNEATLGFHDSGKSNFSAAAYNVKGFDQPSAISYMESHDEERLMYKNITFGNTEGDYSVKDEDTALSRMPAAGAFFFTIPGPKMLWQFGELGYDINIDFNGRTGNKPILWEYADDPDRFAIYESWQDLIKLKTAEPIFKTTDFDLDLGAATGLKTIHLTDNAATGNAIKNITIIGNFGLTEQEINPDFQATGIWYNLLENNKIYEVADTSSTITLAPGEYRIYADNPSMALIDPNDLDSDGVENIDDLCPDTPFGSIVDLSGCEIFSLPSSNFLVAVTGESCAGTDNGSISVTVEELLNYEVSIDGGSTYTTFNATSSNVWEASNLAAGSYEICFKVVGQNDYRQCFEAVIAEPETLSVTSEVDASGVNLVLNLKGSDQYNITLNGKTQTISENNATLALAQGINTISVKTDKQCQGTFEEAIYIAAKAQFTNPIQNSLQFYIPTEKSEVSVFIYDLSGKLVQQQSLPVSAGNAVSVPVTNLDAGLYIVKAATTTFKVLKQ